MDRVIIKKKKNKQKQKQKQKQEQKVIVNIGKDVLRRTKRRRASKPKEPKGESFIPQPRELPPVVYQVPSFQQQVAPSLVQQLPVQRVGQEEQPVADKKVNPQYYNREAFKGFEDVGQMKTNVSFPEEQKFPAEEETKLVAPPPPKPAPTPKPAPDEKSLVSEGSKRGRKKGSKNKPKPTATNVEVQQALPVVNAVPFEDVSVKSSNLGQPSNIPAENPLQQSNLQQQSILDMFRGEPSGKAEPQKPQPKPKPQQKLVLKSKRIDEILDMTGGTDRSVYEKMPNNELNAFYNKMKKNAEKFIRQQQIIKDLESGKIV